MRVLPYAAGELDVLLRAVPFYRRGDVDAQLQCPIRNKVMTALVERIDVNDGVNGRRT